MFKYIISQAGDYNWMAIVSLLLFFGVFLFMLVHTLSLRKAEVDAASRLPLEDGRGETEN